MFGRGDGRASQPEVFAAAAIAAASPRVIQVPQPIRDRVGLHVRRGLVDEAVCEGILQTLGRTQRSGWTRCDSTRSLRTTPAPFWLPPARPAM